MNLLSFFVLIFTIPLCSAAPTSLESSSLPPKALSLKKSYEQAVQQAIEPLNQRYIAGLKSILDQETRAGNLEGALAIKTALSEFSPVNAINSDAVIAFENKVVGTTWLWAKQYPTTFLKDGTVNGAITNWKLSIHIPLNIAIQRTEITGLSFLKVTSARHPSASLTFPQTRSLY